MIDILNMNMDSIAELSTPRREEQKQVDPNNHYIVEGHGVVLTVTEDKAEAMQVYRHSLDTDKKLLKVWQGKQFQLLPRGFY